MLYHFGDYKIDIYIFICEIKMEKLNKDEIFLITKYLHPKSLLNFSLCNKYIFSLCNREEIWNYKLKDFPKTLNVQKKNKEIYELLYSLTQFKNKLGLNKTIYEIYEMQYLKIENTVPKQVLYLVNMRELYLSDVELIKIPTNIDLLTNLKVLSLAGNVLRVIPRELGNLLNLEYLYLQRNKLTEIAIEIGNLTSLKVLNLSNNQLDKIPTDIKNYYSELTVLN